MYIHLFSHGREVVNEPVNIDQALALLERQQDIKKEYENYIGFTAPDDADAVLQFVRYEKDKWLIDIPCIKGDEYDGSFQSFANHGLVFTLVTQFFMPSSSLRRSISDRDYEQMKEMCLKRWNIVFNYEPASDFNE